MGEQSAREQLHNVESELFGGDRESQSFRAIGAFGTTSVQSSEKKSIMKLQSLSTCIGLIASSAAIAFSAEPARAFNFTDGANLGSCDVLVDDTTTPLFKAFIDDTLIKSCTTDDGFTLTASEPGDGFLQGKMVDKDGIVKGVGITVPGEGPVPAEIQNGELLTATLDKASAIDFIDLSFLYRPGVFGDKVFEVAQIMTDTGLIGSLTITGETSAVWSLGGVVTNLDPSKEVEGGYYRIDNPFGDILVSSLKFTAPTMDKRPPTDSDYALVGIGKAPTPPVITPEPATILGLGIVGGLIVASRRKKSS
ncbi:MAG: PEP-CTERM sorting domain-containing protein [Cyanobacteriota bacterium]|nr:PEP-CTERM sorting domain-containing protein [Cyanobacteriota bacterium]